jgi:hypothetical protein
MKTRLFAFAAFLMIGSAVYSQTSSQNNSKTGIPKEVSLEEKLEGTYEIIPNPSTKIVEVFTTDILKEIEARREEHVDVIYEVSKLTTIRIYSRTKISSPGFRKKKN